ncbi:MAG: secretin N-terminal domain-containing protein [Phycisphaeraceae bacterium]
MSTVCAGSVIVATSPAWAERGVEVRPGDGQIVLAEGEVAEAEPESESEPTNGATHPQMVPLTGELEDLPDGQTVEVGSFGQIDLHVQELSLAQVLQLLSIQSQRNIIASRNVSGAVSADLYGVDFYEALDAVLHPNGFGYREQGNFIYVYTRDELAQIEEAERAVVTRIVRLNYLTAADAASFVSPLLSSAGSISVSGETSRGMQPSVSDAGADSFAHSDTLVVRDYPENVEDIERVIEELDNRPRQVLVEATVLEARLEENNAFGVDFAIFADVNRGGFTTPLGAIDEMISGTATDSGLAATANPSSVIDSSSVKIGVMGGDVAAFVQALDSVTDTTVLATPKVLALNRQRAELLVGERIGYLSTTQTDTASTQTVNFLDTGTQLTVRPFISDDSYVRMELKPQVSTGIPQERGGQFIPDEVTQELTTNVIVQSGQTVVLGGLFKEDMQIQRRQVPGLGDLPLVGGLFSGQNDTVGRSEVIFLIKPTILRDESLYAAAGDADRRMELSRVGVRNNLLPWSRTRLTNSHVRKAQEHLDAGREGRALWNVNLALHLQPNLVEALQLKEEITGRRFDSPNRGELNAAVNGMIHAELGADEMDPVDEPAVDESDTDESNGEDDSTFEEFEFGAPVESDESGAWGPGAGEGDVATSGADAEASEPVWLFEAEEVEAQEAEAASEQPARFAPVILELDVWEYAGVEEPASSADEAETEPMSEASDADADEANTEAENETDGAEGLEE